MSIEIKAAEPSDFNYMAHGFTKLLIHIQEKTQDPYFLHIENGMESNAAYLIQEFHEQKGANLLVAYKGPRRVGFIIGQIRPPFLAISKIKSVGEIVICWVDPEYREQGIAKLLTTQMEVHFKKMGIQYVDLHYVVGNQEAENAWRQLGYAPCRILSRKALS